MKRLWFSPRLRTARLHESHWPILLSLCVLLAAFSRAAAQPKTQKADSILAALTNPKITPELRQRILDKSYDQIEPGYYARARGLTIQEKIDFQNNGVMLHFAAFPTERQRAELENLGAKLGLTTWVAPAPPQYSGFLYAQIPLPTIPALAELDFVLRLNDGETVGTQENIFRDEVLKEYEQNPFMHSRMDAVLLQLHAVAQERSLIAGEEWARAHGLRVRDGKVKVIIASHDDRPIAEELILGWKGEVDAAWQGWLKAWLPITSLPKIADELPGQYNVTLPQRPEPDLVVGEGPAATGVNFYQGLGHNGTGVTIGLIDFGYAGMTAAVDDGDAPMASSRTDVNYTSANMEDGTDDHGTACLEVLFDMASAATFRVYKIDDQMDLITAVADGLNNGVDIFSHSVSWYNTGWHDNAGTACAAANNASNGGVIFVTSAGNRARGHWQGNLADADNDNLHAWQGTDEYNRILVSAGQRFTVYLQWNIDGTDVDNYDLLLFADDNGQNPIGTTPQPNEAFEFISITNSSTSTADYWFAVRRNSGDGDFEIFATPYDCEYFTSGNSTTSPSNATGANVIAVAAVDVRSFQQSNPAIENYSSQGPTNDGAQTPQITGPTWISTLTYGPNGFNGTSAATPNVAGAAASRWDFESSPTANSVRTYLLDQARTHRDWGATGIDPIYGNGGLILSPPNVDIALVIDRSGSMGGTKIADAKTAANTFVDVMQDGDKIAVTSFATSASVNYALTTITGAAIKTAAKNAINGLAASGSTSIGGGMQVGQGQLNNGDPNHPHAMLLLSDGMENSPPYVTDILPTIPAKTDIYTIGLGSDVDPTQLQNIANTTGGTYTPAPSSTDLQAIYLRIQGQIKGQQTTSSFTGTITQGLTILHNTILDALTSLATFSMTFEGSDVDLELVTPSGAIINPQVAASDPNITYTEGLTLDSYTVTLPQAGTWTLKIIGLDVPVPETYFAIVQVNSTLKLQTAFDKPNYEAGEPILISASLQANGQAILNATVTANVDAPTTSMLAYREARAGYYQALENDRARTPEAAAPRNGVEHDGTFSIGKSEPLLTSSSLNLFDDGAHGDGAANDGVYANYFTNTINDGSYTFTVQAAGIATPGGAFARESVLSTVVTPSTRIAVVSINPNVAGRGQTLNATITGVNFASGAAVSFSGTGITVNSSTFVNSTQFAANLTIAAVAPLGPRDVIVTNPNGQSANGPALFAITGCASNLFLDEFTDTIADGWLPNLASRWHILSVAGNFAYCVDVANPAGDEYTILNQSMLGDFVLDVKAKTLATSNRIFFILFGVQDFTNSPEDSYYLRFGGGNAGVTLFRSVAGNGVPIASAPDNFADDNQFHAIRIERRGPNIQVYGDLRLLLNVNDATHITGHIGFGSYQSTACFDNVQVSGCPDLPAGPVVFATYNIDDDNGGASNGDGDSRPESGESVELTMALTNRGDRYALDVSAILSTNDPDVTIFDDNNIWPNIAPGATAASWSNFGFQVSPNLAQDKDVTFTLTVISSNAGPWAQSFPIRVYAQNTPAVTDLVADRVFLRTGPNAGSEVTNPVAGQQYYIHFDWRNVGALAANGFRFDLKLNGSLVCSFSSASAPGNSIHNSYCTTPVIWPATGGVIHGALDVNNNLTEPVKNNNAAYRTFGYQSFADFDFTAQVRSLENFNNNGGADLCFVYGYQDDRHYYYVMFNRLSGDTRVYKVRDNDRILVGDLGAFIILDNLYHTVRLVRSGGNLQVFWDNVLLGAVANDAEYGAGGLGVGSYNDTGIFDDICVKPLGGTACTSSDNFEDGNANGWLPLNPAHWDVILDGGDRGYRINDTNYENLEFLRLGEYSLLAPSGQADLVAQRIYLHDSLGTEINTPLAGRSYFVHFDWQNVGAAAANNVPVEIRLNGAVQCVATITANPGESKTTVCNAPITFNPGNYFFESTVDVGNLVSESNENNNSINRTFVVSTTCAPAVCNGPALYPVPQGSTTVGDPIRGRTGSTICVEVRMKSNAQAINAFGFQVQVNPGHLDFTNALAGDLTGNFTTVNANEVPAGSGKIICGGFGTTAIPVNSNGVLIRLCFTVTAATGASSDLLLGSLADDVAGMAACCNTFSATSCLHDGDVNNDKALTPGDAFCSFNVYLNGGNIPANCDALNFTCEADASDVNCDGAATPGDAFAIFTRYLQGLPPQDCFAKTALAKTARPYQLALQQSHLVLSESANEEMLKLVVRVDDPAGLSAFGAQLAYPADKVEPLTVQRTALTAKWVRLEEQSVSAGQLLIGGFDSEALPAGNAAGLFEVLFKTKGQPVRLADFVLSDFTDDLSRATVQTNTGDGLANGIGPRAFRLHQNFPNPFATQSSGNVTMIRFDLPGNDALKTELAIYNLAGQLVRQLLTGTRAPGAYEVAWDGNDESHRPVPSGTYLYRLRAGNQVASKSLVVVR